MILKNSLWRQKTEEKEQRVSEDTVSHMPQHHTSYCTAIPRPRTYHGPAHTMALQYHLTARTSHCNQHPNHPTAAHIPQLCTSRLTAHPTHPTAQHSLPTATNIPLYCTSHCQTSQSECISCPETWASTFHRPSLPCMAGDSSTH